jgi:hypothetical protein
MSNAGYFGRISEGAPAPFGVPYRRTYPSDYFVKFRSQTIPAGYKVSGVIFWQTQLTCLLRSQASAYYQRRSLV